MIQQYRSDITEAIKGFLPSFGVDPYDINNGLCEEFAVAVLGSLNFPLDVADFIWIDDQFEHLEHFAHVVIRLRVGEDVFYFDAECPEGTSDINEIPVVKNKDKTRQQVISERVKPG